MSQLARKISFIWEPASKWMYACVLYLTYPSKLKTDQATRSRRHASATMRNSNDSNGIRTRLQ
ncbi:hypothetical protein Hanom_Chr05g00465891 [Helianthus anomalus]